MGSSSSITEVRTPRETVNDDVVTVLSWNFQNRSPVSSGDVLAEIETSKAAIEIEADSDGFLEILEEKGAQVAVGGMIARIHLSPEFQQSPSDDVESATKNTSPVSASGEVRFSKKARALVDQFALDAAVFSGAGMVKEKDVLEVIRQRGGDAPEADGVATQGEVIAADSSVGLFSEAKRAYESQKTHGLMKDARASAKHRGKSMIGLIWNYFWRNWILNMVVKVSPRGMILRVHRLRGVKIGKDCFVDPGATLETAFPERISIGDDVRIAAGAILMTHIKAPQLLRDSGAIPQVDRGIELHSHSFIGVNAVIMPGVVVGEGAVVASGAVVLSDVPPYTLVAGNPAKVVRQLQPSIK